MRVFRLNADVLDYTRVYPFWVQSPVLLIVVLWRWALLSNIFKYSQILYVSRTDVLRSSKVCTNVLGGVYISKRCNSMLRYLNFYLRISPGVRPFVALIGRLNVDLCLSEWSSQCAITIRLF